MDARQTLLDALHVANFLQELTLIIKQPEHPMQLTALIWRQRQQRSVGAVRLHVSVKQAIKKHGAAGQGSGIVELLDQTLRDGARMAASLGSRRVGGNWRCNHVS